MKFFIAVAYAFLGAFIIDAADTSALGNLAACSGGLFIGLGLYLARRS